jgi:hypothetical protein
MVMLDSSIIIKIYHPLTREGFHTLLKEKLNIYFQVCMEWIIYKDMSI